MTDARRRLVGVADYVLMHDRDIAERIDDSVRARHRDKPRMMRRARGYAPAPIALPAVSPICRRWRWAGS